MFCGEWSYAACDKAMDAEVVYDVHEVLGELASDSYWSGQGLQVCDLLRGNEWVSRGCENTRFAHNRGDTSIIAQIEVFQIGVAGRRIVEVGDKDVAVHVLGKLRSIGWQHDYKKEGRRCSMATRMGEEVLRADELEGLDLHESRCQ